MSETLVQLYRFHLWANLQLLDFCSHLTDEQLNASFPGTAGSIRQTFRHIVANEENYLQLITGQGPETSLRDVPQPVSFEELQKRTEWNGRQFIHLAQTLPDGYILHGTHEGEEYILPAYIPMLQCIHHGIEHRTQIKSTVSQLGMQPPELDGWSYDEAIRPAG